MMWSVDSIELIFFIDTCATNLDINIGILLILHNDILPSSQNKCNSIIQILSHKECNFD
jgi:hypothetical protein